jgi:hypothetical protein
VWWDFIVAFLIIWYVSASCTSHFRE